MLFAINTQPILCGANTTPMLEYSSTGTGSCARDEKQMKHQIRPVSLTIVPIVSLAPIFTLLIVIKTREIPRFRCGGAAVAVTQLRLVYWLLAIQGARLKFKVYKVVKYPSSD